MTPNLKLHEFRPNARDPITGKRIHDLHNKVIAVLGPRGSGKSFLIKDLLTKIQDIPVVRVINGTEEMTGYYSSFIPSICIDEKYNEDIITKFVERQRKIYRKKKRDPAYANVDARALLLLDDCGYDKKWSSSEAMHWLFYNGRHGDTSFIFANQTPLGLKYDLRGNVDYVFIFNHPTYKDRDRIYENYISGFKNKKEFNRVLDKVAQDHRVMVINKTARSGKIEDIVFWYKARDHPNFHFGSPLLWKMQGQKFDSNYEKRQETMERHKEDLENKIKAYKQKKEENLLGGENIEVAMVP